MNVLADECVDRAIVERLRSDGHVVTWIKELAPSSSDEEVLTFAHESDSILVTDDKDFGELVYRLGRTHSGVVLLRLDAIPNSVKATKVSAVLRDYAEELVGAFTVITVDTVRIRRPTTDDSESR